MQAVPNNHVYIHSYMYMHDVAITYIANYIAMAHIHLAIL